jgi:thioesterase domain-containing protein/acyl carrier protein
MIDTSSRTQDAVEKTLVSMWQRILNIDEPIGWNADFFDLGGTSMQLSRLFLEIEHTFGTRLPFATLFQSASLEHLARAIREHPASPPASSLVSLNPEGSAQPLFWAHETGGEIFGLLNLSVHLGPNRPLYGFQARGVDGKETPHSRLEEMADHYVGLMRTVQAHGPYLLGGQSFGGVIAFEMARQLQRQGEEVAMLLLVDARAPLPKPLIAKVAFHLRRAVKLRRAGPRYAVGHARLAVRRVAWKLRERIRSGRDGSAPVATTERLATAFSVLRSRYRPGVYRGRAILFRIAGETQPDLGWGTLITGGVEVHPIPGLHGWSLSEPYIQVVGPLLRACLARLDGPR